MFDGDEHEPSSGRYSRARSLSPPNRRRMSWDEFNETRTFFQERFDKEAASLEVNLRSFLDRLTQSRAHTDDEGAGFGFDYSHDLGLASEQLRLLATDLLRRAANQERDLNGAYFQEVHNPCPGVTFRRSLFFTNHSSVRPPDMLSGNPFRCHKTGGLSMDVLCVMCYVCAPPSTCAHIAHDKPLCLSPAIPALCTMLCRPCPSLHISIEAIANRLARAHNRLPPPSPPRHPAMPLLGWFLDLPRQS